MARRRLAVALLVSTSWAAEIDGLRRACGDAQLERVAPHVTLVPPINIAEADVSAVLGLVRRAAAEVGAPLRFHLGPTNSFLPDSPVLYLAVQGESIDDGSLVKVRAALRSGDGPLARADRWPFVPHVTLAQDQPDERLLAGVTSLASYEVDVELDRIHLLEERAGESGGRRWIPIGDARFGPRAVVGRGSLPLELTTGSVIDPEALALCQAAGVTLVAEVAVGRSDRQVVVTARRADGAHGGEVVGVAAGPRAAASPTVLAVDPAALGEGIDDHLLARWSWSAEV